jgi:hypothetical protein
MEWWLIKSTYMPAIKDYYELFKLRMQRSSDRNSMLEHITEFTACSAYALQLAEIVGPLPNLYKEDPNNALNMVPAPEFMHREYEIRDDDKKKWFLAGLTRTDYTALKSAMIIVDDITYEAMIIKFTKIMDALESAGRTLVMSSNSRLRLHPSSESVLTSTRLIRLLLVLILLKP